MPLISTTGRGRVLDFDIENRPLSYWIPDEPTAEITAIASCWVGDPHSMDVLLLGEVSLEYMLREFVKRYNEADLVTGHYIRKHDLPHINAGLMEMGMPTLTPKLVSDTKLDMFRKAGLPATQEYLLALLGIPVQKVHMTQEDWREANRLTPKGIAKTRKRVQSDVEGHMLLREAMLARGMLRGPRVWNPGGGEWGVVEDDES